MQSFACDWSSGRPWKRSSDQRFKNVNRSCWIDATLSAQTQFQPYAFRESETIGELAKNMVADHQCHDDVSKKAMQDSVSKPDSQVFLPESDSDLESEDEADFDYNLCEISGNQIF